MLVSGRVIVLDFLWEGMRGFQNMKKLPGKETLYIYIDNILIYSIYIYIYLHHPPTFWLNGSTSKYQCSHWFLYEIQENPPLPRRVLPTSSSRRQRINSDHMALAISTVKPRVFSAKRNVFQRGKTNGELGFEPWNPWKF